MLVSFPHMGRLHFALEKVFRIMEIPYIVPPFPGPIALHKGSELAPEGSCLPFCLVLGNMCEALERGADTLVMLGGRDLAVLVILFIWRKKSCWMPDMILKC